MMSGENKKMPIYVPKQTDSSLSSQSSTRNSKNSGFTLVEVMIVVVIITILGGVAYPSYLEYIRKGNRTDAMGSLTIAAQAMERCSINNNSIYTGCAQAAYDSAEGHYQITTASTATTYTITATAQGAQAKDLKCTAFTISNTGAQGFTGSASVEECWNK